MDLKCDGRSISLSKGKQGEGLAFGRSIGMFTGKITSRKARDSRNQNGNMVKTIGRNGPEMQDRYYDAYDEWDYAAQLVLMIDSVRRIPMNADDEMWKRN